MNKCKPLTVGNPSVVDYRIFNSTHEDQFLRTVAAAESQSEHPIAKAILRFVRSKLVVGGGGDGDGDGSAGGRGLHSSNSQLNLSHFWHSTHPLNAQTPPPPPSLTLPKHPLNTPCPTKNACVELTSGRV